MYGIGSFEALRSVAIIVDLPPTLRFSAVRREFLWSPPGTLPLFPALFVLSDTRNAVIYAVSFLFSLVNIAWARPCASVALFPGSLHVAFAPMIVRKS